MVFTFTNTFTPPPSLDGRMTGGGAQVYGDIKIIRRCDDPAYQEKPPVAPFNTFIGEGIGRLNAVDGSKVYCTFIDAGEPAKNDKAATRIIAPDGEVLGSAMPSTE